MRHRVAGYKLGRDTEHRTAMRRNLAISLLTHGQVTTTIPKAKSVKPFVEKLISSARKGDLASRRRVLQAIGDPYLIAHEDDPDVVRNRYGEVVSAPRVVKKLFDEIAPRYADRPGGYTRIVRLGTHRIGDGSDLCVLQLVGSEEGPQVSGAYSRRRDKADRRMEYAAQQRRDQTAAVVEEPSPEEAEDPSPPEAEEAESSTETLQKDE